MENGIHPVRVATSGVNPFPRIVPHQDGAGVIDRVGAGCLGIPAITAHACLFSDGAVEGKTVLVPGGAFPWPRWPPRTRRWKRVTSAAR